MEGESEQLEDNGIERERDAWAVESVMELAMEQKECPMIGSAVVESAAPLGLSS